MLCGSTSAQRTRREWKKVNWLASGVLLMGDPLSGWPGERACWALSRQVRDATRMGGDKRGRWLVALARLTLDVWRSPTPRPGLVASERERVARRPR